MPRTEEPLLAEMPWQSWHHASCSAHSSTATPAWLAEERWRPRASPTTQPMVATTGAADPGGAQSAPSAAACGVYRRPCPTPDDLTTRRRLGAASAHSCRSGRDLGLTSAPNLAGRRSPGGRPAQSASRRCCPSGAQVLPQPTVTAPANDLRAPDRASPCSPSRGPRRERATVEMDTAVDWLSGQGLRRAGVYSRAA